jgi:XapX domain-containing protein
MSDIKPYVLALCVGLLVGIIYAMLNVRSPAPPVVALMGLLGILLGEQVVPLAKGLFAGHRLTAASIREHCGHHVFGPLPTRATAPVAGHAPPPEHCEPEGRI